MGSQRQLHPRSPLHRWHMVGSSLRARLDAHQKEATSDQCGRRRTIDRDRRLARAPCGAALGTAAFSRSGDPPERRRPRARHHRPRRRGEPNCWRRADGHFFAGCVVPTSHKSSAVRFGQQAGINSISQLENASAQGLRSASLARCAWTEVQGLHTRTSTAKKNQTIGVASWRFSGLRFAAFSSRALHGQPLSVVQIAHHDKPTRASSAHRHRLPLGERQRPRLAAQASCGFFGLGPRLRQPHGLARQRRGPLP